MSMVLSDIDYMGLELHDKTYLYPLEDLGRFSHIDVDSSCFNYALGDILQMCRDVGVESLDLEKRKLLSVKLTLCEMTSLGLPFPSVCGNIVDTDDCIQSLEKVPQYWTLFSGNYREIRKICFEESLPFEKSQILKLYTNITKVFVKLHNDLVTSGSTTNDQQDKLEKKFEDLLNQVLILKNEIVDVQSSTVKDFTLVAGDTLSTLQMSFDLLQSFVGKSSVSLNEISVNFNFLSGQINDMLLVIESSNIQKSMDVLEFEVDMKMRDIASNIDSVVNNVKNRMNEMDSYAVANSAVGTNLKKDLEYSNNLVTKINEMLKNVETKALSQELVDTDQVSHFLDSLFFGLELSFHHFETKLDDYIMEIDTKASETLKKIDRTNKAIDSIFNLFDSWVNLIQRVFKSISHLPLPSGVIILFQKLKAFCTLWNFAIVSLVVCTVGIYSRLIKPPVKKKKRSKKSRKVFISFRLLLAVYFLFYFWMIYLIFRMHFGSSPDFVENSYQYRDTDKTIAV